MCVPPYRELQDCEFRLGVAVASQDRAAPLGCRRGPDLHTGGATMTGVPICFLVVFWGGAGLVTVGQTFVLGGQGTQAACTNLPGRYPGDCYNP